MIHKLSVVLMLTDSFPCTEPDAGRNLTSSTQPQRHEISSYVILRGGHGRL